MGARHGSCRGQGTDSISKKNSEILRPSLRPDRPQFYVQIDLNFTSRSTSILHPDRPLFTSRSTSILRSDRPQFYVRFTCKLYVRASIPKLTKKFTRGDFATNLFIGYKIYKRSYGTMDPWISCWSCCWCCCFC
mgnify:CR=1 FL=1